MPYSAGLIRAKERTERSIVYTRTGANDPDSPEYECASYLAQIGDVEMMREVAGGTKTMREAGKKYLPKHPMESDAKYADRISIAVAYNALGRTISGLVGMVFRRDPVTDDAVPKPISEHLTDVDMRGRDLSVFMRGMGENAMTDGHTWVHVESPRRDETITNRRAEERAGIRPYWINVKKANAINWRYEMRAGRPTLTLFVYRESATEPTGAFGATVRQRLRVLREVREMGDLGVVESEIQGELWELREKREGQEKPEWLMIEGPYLIENVTEVPVVFVPANPADRRAEFSSTPPLLDLAFEQVEHYRVRSDRQKSLTFSSVSVPWATGKEVTDAQGNSRVRWGADSMMLLNDPEATFGVLESHGYGLDATKEELREIEGRMAALGLQMLLQDPGTTPRTATEQILEKSESDAALVLFAKAMEAGANECLRLHAAYRGIEAAGEVKVNRDFRDQLIDPQLLARLSEMVAAEQLSLETMWSLLVAGELLPEAFDPEDEKGRIRAESARRLEDDPLLQALRGTGTDDEDDEDDDDEEAA